MSHFLTLAAWPASEELTLFLTMFLGMGLGRISYRGFSLGTGGIIFVAMLAGHYGYESSAAVGTVGMVLFVFCLGIGAGPGFFQTLSQHGLTLALLGMAMIFTAASTAGLIGYLFRLPADLVTGLFAGALTSTPALATVSEFLPADSQLAVGFGIAYPLGTLLVILFVQFYPRFLAKNLIEEASLATPATSPTAIGRQYVEVLNPAVVGKHLNELPLLEGTNCQVARVLLADEYRPIPHHFTLQAGQHLLIVGEADDLAGIVDLFGRPSEKREENEAMADKHRRRVVVTSRDIVGKSLRELQLRSRFGVTISRVRRHDLEFVPDSRTHFHRGDAVTAIGEPEQLDQFMAFAGHRERSFDETDLISLTCGLVLGILLGSVEFRVGSDGFSLGKAGGPLVMGLILGHFGRIGPFMGHFPAAARLLLTELGLALFLTDSGIRAGRDFVTVLSQHGVVLLIGGAITTLMPLIVGLLLGQWVLKLKRQQLIGGICGAMTSTPSLGALMADENSNAAIRSYASIYPLALILMSLVAPILLSLLS